MNPHVRIAHLNLNAAHRQLSNSSQSYLFLQNSFVYKGLRSIIVLIDLEPFNIVLSFTINGNKY